MTAVSLTIPPPPGTCRSYGPERPAGATRSVLPPLIPAVLTGFALAFARGVGEYGSVIFLAGNLPHVSEIAPLLIVIKLSEFDYGGAAAIATIMLGISFLTLWFATSAGFIGGAIIGLVVLFGGYNFLVKHEEHQPLDVWTEGR